jgi:hypothetical protein
MNSTPKQHDGDASVAASGSLSPLEQTVMGMAPPPPRPAASSAPALEPAGIIVPSSVIAPSGPPAPPSVDGAHAGPPPSATLVAAPTIAVSQVPAEPAPDASGAASPAFAREPASAGETAAPSEAPLGATLRIEPGKPAVLAPPRPAASERAERAVPSERTALSADYLREARAAALDQVAERPPPTAPLALASTERAPMAEVAAAVASALPTVGDTHRSVAPALEPAPASARVASPIGPAPARGFEPVPVVRAPLAESLSSALGPLAELGGTRNLLPPSSLPRPVAPRERESGVGRWLLLAAVALVTVGVVSVGGRLWHRYRNPVARQRVVATVEAGASIPAVPSHADAPAASHALLANRPAPEPAGAASVSVVSATASAPAIAPGVSASPESQLAATAGRYVLSGNYAEALPLYRQLERSWPENTAYAAMARLLEKKVGSHNDTRTVAPAAAP